MVKKASLGKKYKLSDIWTWASRDLKQVKHDYGSVLNKQACALGAIEYYRSGKRKITPNYNIWAQISYKTDIDKFEKEYNGIAYLNDKTKSWSFKRFAEAAKKIGL